MARISCLGPEGSYSALAAERLCPGDGVLLCRNFREVICALTEGEAQSAVIPIENSIQGGVLQNLDLLESADVFAVQEYVLPIDHRLATLQGVAYKDVRRIYSHEQAIGQCSEFLQENFPGAQMIYTQSTAQSLQMLDGESAGIVGSHVSKEGVVLSEQNIANEKRNYTRFLQLVNRGEVPKHSNKIFLRAVRPHEPGALLGLLQIFAAYGLNMTRIESRPIRNVFGEYRFFIEVSGDVGEKSVREALEAAQKEHFQLRLLGAY